ncbi:histidine kinase 2 isoform X1 [Nicotiana tabacum]|uniref:Histidine kinase 2 isoform X1 n=1 Tax=Nicotiana tabacum TaxID=4097 RepID=A0AC58TAF3_TOBAC|nr:histidine kinase 2 isoform X2 [Nicotiana tomentosiformis]
MSFSALSGFALKLSRHFLKICRWILLKMSLNCKLLGMNGSFSSSFRLKKAKESLQVPNCGWSLQRKLLFLWLIFFGIGFVWLVISLNGVVYSWKQESSEPNEDKSDFILEHFNVTKQQIQALATLFFEKDQEMPMSTTITCLLKVLGSENLKYEQQYEMAVENFQAKGQCPVPDEDALRNSDISLDDKSLPFVLHRLSSLVSADPQFFQKKASQIREVGNHNADHCNSIAFCFTKLCWWVLLGIVVSWKMLQLCTKCGENQQHSFIQQQPLSQQLHPLQQLQQQQAWISSRTGGKWRKKLLVIFVSAGVISAIWLYWYMNADIALRRKETLASMCDERARMLQDQFNVSMNHVHALAILVSTFHHGKQPSAIDQKTFEEYTERTAFERPLTSGVAYALRVRHSEREVFEKLHGWTIKKMESEDQTLAQDYIPANLDPAPDQDEYAPVIFSQQTVSHIVSIDMMSGKEDRENILRARASGKGVLTSPFKLLKSNHLGVVLTFAVYNTHLPPYATPVQRINATVGYIGASYDVPSLVEKLLHQLASKQTIVVNVYDTTNKFAPIQMYGMDENDTGLLHVSNLDFGDPARKHEMHCRFKQKPSPPWTAIAASVGVLVITLLVGHIFHAAINRIVEVEGQYQEMMELKHRAEAADIAKSQFLATVSHEIRTPMNGVLGMLQMLMDTNLDPTQLDYAQTAHASGKDLISLINEVLDQAKIESGRLELEAVPFDLRAVLDNVSSLFSGRSHKKGIELAVYVSDLVPEVVIGDPGRFRQIITNLVGNSIKFTNDKGHIFVTVHLADEVRNPHDVTDEVLKQSLTVVQERSNASWNTLSGFPVVDRWQSWQKFDRLSSTEEEVGKIKLLVTIEDTGVGIPVEAQDRIFTPFMQADSSTSRTYGGTGIGLSISKRLVDLMGGEIGFFSESGTGSTFSFTASFARGEEGSLERKWQQYDPAVSEFRGLRALVIDDKSIRAEVTRYHLQRLGICVNITSTMRSACSYLSSYSNTSASGHLAVVFVDNDSWDKETSLTLCNMLKELRPNGSTTALKKRPKICLLCMSTMERDELKSAGIVDHVLAKPVRLSGLITCFQEAIGYQNKKQVTRGKPSTLGSLLTGKHILVVDDNAVNRRVAEGALKKYGAIVTCVDSGKAALAHLNPPHKFDACFMDLQMPEMCGFDATRQIRSLENKYNEKVDSGELLPSMSAKVAHWYTPILAMTADVIQATNEECMKCGMDDYVSKPFEEGQLYSAVARFFESG